MPIKWFVQVPQTGQPFLRKYIRRRIMEEKNGKEKHQDPRPFVLFRYSFCCCLITGWNGAAGSNMCRNGRASLRSRHFIRLHCWFSITLALLSRRLHHCVAPLLEILPPSFHNLLGDWQVVLVNWTLDFKITFSAVLITLELIPAGWQSVACSTILATHCGCEAKGRKEGRRADSGRRPTPLFDRATFYHRHWATRARERERR